MDYIDLLQWPAMVVTIVAAWLVASQSKRKSTIGFWVFLASNVLWSVWGWHRAPTRSSCSSSRSRMNVRGVYRNDPELKVTTGKE